MTLTQHLRQSRSICESVVAYSHYPAALCAIACIGMSRLLFYLLTPICFFIIILKQGLTRISQAVLELCVAQPDLKVIPFLLCQCIVT